MERYGYVERMLNYIIFYSLMSGLICPCINYCTCILTKELFFSGWMQLAILIYQMTDASGILPVYMHARVLVSAYLFLSGYGHFTYFWHRGEAGIVRFFQVMLYLSNSFLQIEIFTISQFVNILIFFYRFYFV